jgi:uncharacterized membrane protein YphA (DoxX/SURF4 family)
MGHLSLIQICQILIGLFLGICMFQSGTDKILDWKGNSKWLQDHFSKSFLNPIVKPMLLIILILEIISGILCLSGSLFGLLNNDTSLILTGLIIVGINLIALFFGQRYAKDYEGAAVLVSYFTITIIGIFSFSFA